jgi:translocation and assembly module TamA
MAGAASAEVRLSLQGDPPGILEDNLRAHLRLSGEDCDSPSWRVRRFMRAAEKDMQPALRALGYYRARIDKRFEPDDDGCWLAVFEVDPGERVTVRSRSVVVEGPAADDERMTRLLEALPLARGRPLDHGEYEQIKSRLRSFAAQYGYLDFRITRQQLRVYPDENAAEIDIVADSGQRYRYGELHFGPHPLTDDLVRRLALTTSGEAYDSGSLAAIDRHLSDTGYFRSVEVRPRRSEARDGIVPIDIVLDPASRHAWRVGAGYSTDTLWRLSLGYDNRYLNPRGHRLESALRLGPVESGLKADYLVPGHDPHNENFSFGARLLRERTDTSENDSAALIGRQVLKTGRWSQTRFLELLYEESTVAGVSDTYRLLMPGIAFDRVRYDDLLRPEQGYRVNLELRGAAQALGSTTSMVQFRGKVKGVYRFPGAGRVLARVDLGLTAADSADELPGTLRFFAGGDNSVRGYDYKSLGPADDDGEVEGGLNLLTGSLEYEHPVVDDDWWAAVFVDAGNAYDFEEFEPRIGIGFGVRWYSPVGRIRLDIAFPDDQEDDDWRIHFGLGGSL